MIHTGELIQCKECGAEFRKNPFSTIQHKFCYRCQKLKDFEKSKARIEKNKKLLSDSSFVQRNKRSTPKMNGSATSKVQGVKMAKKRTNKKQPTKNIARNSADAYFSKYIRLKHSFESGGKRYCKCYTCGKIIPIKHNRGQKNGAENGHWQRRGYYETRYHENNGRPQCYQCNYWNQGKPEIFEQNLIKEIGEKKVNEIKQFALSDTQNDNIIFLNQQIDKYKKLFKELMKEYGYKNWSEL
jgi:hypothetical protein